VSFDEMCTNADIRWQNSTFFTMNNKSLAVCVAY